jgi:hypothetical protein
MRRYVFGIRNTAFWVVRPEGDEMWYPSKRSRDAALQAMRAQAEAAGLSPTRCVSGIRPIRRHVGSASGAAWLDNLTEGRQIPGVVLVEE